MTSKLGIMMMAAMLAASPAISKTQSVQEACQDIVAANDLAKGAYLVRDAACNQANRDYTPENCTMVAHAAEFAQKTAMVELRKCKPALARARAAAQ